MLTLDNRRHTLDKARPSSRRKATWTPAEVDDFFGGSLTEAASHLVTNIAEKYLDPRRGNPLSPLPSPEKQHSQHQHRLWSDTDPFFLDSVVTMTVRRCTLCHNYIDGAPNPNLTHVGKFGPDCTSDHHPAPCDYTQRESGPCKFYGDSQAVDTEVGDLSNEQLQVRDKNRQEELDRMAGELVSLKAKQVEFDQMSAELAEMRNMIKSINRAAPIPTDKSVPTVQPSPSNSQQQLNTQSVDQFGPGSQGGVGGAGQNDLLHDVTAHIEKNSSPPTSGQSRGAYTGSTMDDLRKDSDLDRIAAKVLAALETKIPQIRTQLANVELPQIAQHNTNQPIPSVGTHTGAHTQLTTALPNRPSTSHSQGPTYAPSLSQPHAAYTALLSGASGGQAGGIDQVPADRLGGGLLVPEDQFLDAAAIMNMCTVSNRRQLRPHEFARMGRFSYASKITDKNITVPLFVLGYLQYVVAMLKNVAPKQSETEVVDRLINLMTIMEITSNNSTLEDFKCPGWSIGLEYASRIFHDIEYGRLKWENLADGLQPHTFLYAKDTVDMQQQQSRAGRGGRSDRGDQARGRGRGRGGGGRGGSMPGQRSDDTNKVCMSYNGFWTGSGCAYEYNNDRRCGYEHFCSSCFERTGVKEKHKAYYCDPAGAMKTSQIGSDSNKPVTTSS